MSLLSLYLIFFKIGLFTIGGGLASLPLLLNEAIRRNWFSMEEFYHMVAISESTPGPIGVNMASYVGLESAGIPGSIAATFGLVTPSLIIIILIAKYFLHFNEKPLVQAGLSGLRPAVTGLIATAAFKVLTVAVFPWERFRETQEIISLFPLPELILFILLGTAFLIWKGHPLFYILTGALGGIILL